MIKRITCVGDALEILSHDEAIKAFRHWPYVRNAGEAHIRYKEDFGIWFRGHADSEWQLTPSGFPRLGGYSHYDEGSSFYHFMLRTSRDIKVSSTFEGLCLMQHYLAPTRLLDWSENLLVALFFAVQNPKRRDRPGTLYLLNAAKLNFITRQYPAKRSAICVPTTLEVAVRSEMSLAVTLSDLIDQLTSLGPGSVIEGQLIEEVRSKLRAELKVHPSNRPTLDGFRAPIAVLPARSHTRMILQQSAFTLHGGKLHAYEVDESDRIPPPQTLEELNQTVAPDRQFLISIPITNKEKILKELEMMGIHGAAIFPELEDQAEYIREKWSF